MLAVVLFGALAMYKRKRYDSDLAHTRTVAKTIGKPTARRTSQGAGLEADELPFDEDAFDERGSPLGGASSRGSNRSGGWSRAGSRTPAGSRPGSKTPDAFSISRPPSKTPGGTSSTVRRSLYDNTGPVLGNLNITAEEYEAQQGLRTPPRKVLHPLYTPSRPLPSRCQTPSRPPLDAPAPITAPSLPSTLRSLALTIA
eukprot:1191083-Prorocentrum_minimum.AAC.1